MTSAIRAGNLDHVIALQRVTRTISASGEPQETWATFATVRAQRLSASIDEKSKDWGDSGQATITWRIRWVEDLRLDDRVFIFGVAHDIKNITPLGRHEALELTTLAQR